MKVTVYYDYICPYCYLGTKRILTLSEEFDLSLDWKGIEIHPEFPPEGKKRSKTIKSKSFAKTIYTIAKEDDIMIKLPGYSTNSRLALEASEYAKTKDMFLNYHIGIYEAYFVEGLNIGDQEIVLNISENAGLNRNELEECLSNRSMFDSIEINKKQAEDNIILGVPTFVFGNFPLHGIQSTQTMRDIIKRSLERTGL